MLRDAVVDELIETNPCVLKPRELPSKVDKILVEIQTGNGPYLYAFACIPTRDRRRVRRFRAKASIPLIVLADPDR
jgi:hypothetical protein